jgi:hypothetical protein
MIRSPFVSEADRLTYRKWVRAVAIVYSGFALILFGLVLFGGPLGVMGPNHPADRAVASTAVSGERGTAQHAACRGRHDMSCPGLSARE